MLIRIFASTALALILTLRLLEAQSTSGAITGLVTDSTGAVIPNAVVVATNTLTGVKAQTLTSSTGNSVFHTCPVGPYELNIAISGFKATTRSGIRITSDDNLRIDVTLEVGQTSERVNVSAEAPPLKTESTEVSSVM